MLKKNNHPCSSANRAIPKLPLTVELLEDRLVLSSDFYTITGIGNNVLAPDWGSAETALLRIVSVEHGDGLSDPAGEDRPSARVISNGIVAQSESITNDRFLTDFIWLWGQFIDHDIDLTEGADPAEPFDILVPTGDPFFDPQGTGSQTIGLNRSVYEVDENGIRQQINQITAFLDGSVIYGSDAVRATALRTFEGGRLKTSEGNLLPFNEAGLPNAGGPGANLFLAGDVRANENAALTAMHTLWVREHNYQAEQIAANDPVLTDEEIYQQARAIVIAELQAITYNAFLPALLGEGAIAPYSGYHSNVNPGIANIFSTASYRLGHSLLSPELLRLDRDGNVIDAGNLALRDAFFAPHKVTTNGIDSLLLGAASQVAQELDSMIIDDVRNFLFGPPGSGGFDLASLNLQRGRDHGIPSYNQARIDLGLAPVTSFVDITSDTEVQARLEAIYGDVNQIDLWVGALAEEHVTGASVGELNYTVLVDQFTRIRDGDRFWYETLYSGAQLAELQNTTLADVIERNTTIQGLQTNVFFDQSVLYYKGEYGAKPMKVIVKAHHHQLQLIDQKTGRVIHSRPAEEVNRIYLVGQNGVNDLFVIRPGSRYNLPPILIYGGEDDRDRLKVVGTNDSDTVSIDSTHLQLNGWSLTLSAIDEVMISLKGGDDSITVDASVEHDLTIYGGPGRDTLVDPEQIAHFDEGRQHGPKKGHGHRNKHG